MTVAAVTARSAGGLRPAQRPAPIGVPGRKGAVIPFPRRVGGLLPADLVPLGDPVKAMRATRKLISLFKPTPQSAAVGYAIEFAMNRTFPDGFPGWGNFTERYCSGAEHGHHDTDPSNDLEPGQFTTNGFDVNPYHPTNTDGLIDADSGDIFGRQYWGHFHGYSQDPATMEPHPMADDWPLVPVPLAVPGTAPAARPLRDLSVSPAVRWTPASAIVFTVRIGANGREALEIGFRQTRTRPRKREREHKAQLTSTAHHILKEIISAVTEHLDLVSVLAEASHYHPDSLLIPEDLPHDGVAAKLYWLFVVGGINHMDWLELAEAYRKEQLDDAVYGVVGALAGHGSRGLGLTVGVQAGPAL